MPGNKRQLTTRVSQETADAFHAQREELGLSMNQFLKFLVLVAQDRTLELEALDDDVDTESLKDWLRGK